MTMTLSEAVESSRRGKIDFVQIVNKDYRGCKPITKEKFIRMYKGTDVWYESIKDFCVEDYEGTSFTLLSIAL